MAHNWDEPRYTPPSRPGYTPPKEIEEIRKNIREEPVFPCCPECGCRLPAGEPAKPSGETICPNCKAKVRVEIGEGRQPGNPPARGGEGSAAGSSD